MTRDCFILVIAFMLSNKGVGQTFLSARYSNHGAPPRIGAFAL